jgi:hypothetical protein
MSSLKEFRNLFWVPFKSKERCEAAGISFIRPLLRYYRKCAKATFSKNRRMWFELCVIYTEVLIWYDSAAHNYGYAGEPKDNYKNATKALREAYVPPGHGQTGPWPWDIENMLADPRAYASLAEDKVRKELWKQRRKEMENK